MSVIKPLTLQEDLIRDFQEQKHNIAEQVSLIDPMATLLRKPAAKRLIHAGLLVVVEIFSWILVLATIAFIIFIDKLYPYYLIPKISNDAHVLVKYTEQDMRMLAWAVRGIAMVLVIALVIIARMVATIRKKNSVLNVAGRNMKMLAEQMLKRKASMEMLEQRYPMEMPSDADSIVKPIAKSHDDILL